MLFIAFGILIFSCKKKAETEEINPGHDPDPVAISLFNPPSYFPAPVYDFSQNPLAADKIALGRMLFYDPILSIDSTISCASCHRQVASFTDSRKSVSKGIDNHNGKRNSPGIYNLAWATSFMWDGNAKTLDIQPILPMSNPLEMGNNLQNALTTLNLNTKYRQLFKAAWDVNEIKSEQLLKSLSQFMLTILSSNSKYDHYKQGKATLSTNEAEGMLIVQQKCAQCHSGELFTDFKFRNIGIDSTTGLNDFGVEALTSLPEDRRKFKTPSLRNFAFTAPYLHNGTAFTLDAVLDRHDSLVNVTSTLDPLMTVNGVVGIKLTKTERLRIQDFLNTLSDSTLKTNPAFSNPFLK